MCAFSICWALSKLELSHRDDPIYFMGMILLINVVSSLNAVKKHHPAAPDTFTGAPK